MKDRQSHSTPHSPHNHLGHHTQVTSNIYSELDQTTDKLIRLR